MFYSILNALEISLFEYYLLSIVVNNSLSNNLFLMHHKLLWLTGFSCNRSPGQLAHISIWNCLLFAMNTICWYEISVLKCSTAVLKCSTAVLLRSVRVLLFQHLENGAPPTSFLCGNSILRTPCATITAPPLVCQDVCMWGTIMDLGRLCRPLVITWNTDKQSLNTHVPKRWASSAGE